MPAGEDEIGAHGADQATREVIDAAVARFAQAGLELPALQIHVHDADEPCGGHMGLYGKRGDKHRIDICDAYPEVVLHELAHAWEYHSLDDWARARFLADVGLAGWADPDTQHRMRGIEQMAYLIAWGLGDKPIQRITFPHHADDLALFERVTGRPSPRIAHLIETRTAAATGLASRHSIAPTALWLPPFPRSATGTWNSAQLAIVPRCLPCGRGGKGRSLSDPG